MFLPLFDGWWPYGSCIVEAEGNYILFFHQHPYFWPMCANVLVGDPLPKFSQLPRGRL